MGILVSALFIIAGIILVRYGVSAISAGIMGLFGTKVKDESSNNS